MNLRICIITLAWLFAAAVHASDLTDAELQRLASNLQKAKSQTEMNLASKELAEFWDARLTVIEARIQRRLVRKERKEFTGSKKRWRLYRSSEIAFRASFHGGGSIQPLIANSAYSEITEHRVSEMESLFSEALDSRAEQGGATNSVVYRDKKKF